MWNHMCRYVECKFINTLDNSCLFGCSSIRFHFIQSKRQMHTESGVFGSLSRLHEVIFIWCICANVVHSLLSDIKDFHFFALCAYGFTCKILFLFFFFLVSESTVFLLSSFKLSILHSICIIPQRSLYSICTYYIYSVSLLLIFPAFQCSEFWMLLQQTLID